MPVTAPGPGIKKRIIFLFFVTVSVLAFLGGRVFWFQFFRGEELRVRAQEVRTRYIPVEPRRGVIYDARGRELAISISVDTVVANPAEIEDPEGTAARLATVLDMPADDILKIITRNTSFEYVRRKIDAERSRAVRRMNLPGIYLTQESRRVYPKGGLAANILGFAGMDSQGLEGVEKIHDEELRGEPGYITMEYDARNREIPQAVHRYIAPEDGLNARLTIDETIQYIAEREIEKVWRQSQAKAALMIIMDPANGEILALAQRPSYDPNKAMDYLLHADPAGKEDVDSKLWRNLAISDAYPPGSVFKPVTAAAALAEGKVTPQTGFYDTGSVTVPGSIISNWDGGGLGSTTFAEGFKFSANTIFARVGLMVGKELFYDYLDALDFDSYTGIDLPGEGVGLMPTRKEAKPLDLALMAFGQTLTVTPIRMITATATLINGGKPVKPHLVREFLDQEGNVVKRTATEPIARVIPLEVSDTVRILMGSVVDEGTGRQARIPGYAIGGKTGTSQKVVDGRVVTDRHIASFLGFVPLEDPKLLAYVMVDEPKTAPYGGMVAAPVFEAVMRDILHYLGIRPTKEIQTVDPVRPWQKLTPVPTPPEELPQANVPDMLNMPVEEARAAAARAGLQLQTVGNGSRVLSQTPPSGTTVPEGTRVFVYLDDSAAGATEAGVMVTVPDFTGKTLREVARNAGLMGLILEARGTGVATAQEPPPGTRLPARSRVRVDFSPPEATSGYE